MATASTQAPGRGRKSALRNPVTWVIVLGIALAGGAYLLYRRNQSNAAAANSSTAAPSTEDYAGQIATLQSEVADLQSTFTQAETGEKAPADTDTTPSDTDKQPTGGVDQPGAKKLTAPTGFSITPHAGYADFGWSTVPGAKAYELQVAGAGGRGTGASHYDHAGSGNHAEKVKLSNGSYKARVRAGTSVTSLSGPWTAYKGFEVGRRIGPAPKPHQGPEPED